MPTPKHPLFTLRILLFASCCSLILSASPKPTCAADPAPKPTNVVLIMADDLGWSDLACYGNDFVDTPRIDELARTGMRFTNFYAAGAVCSPTRCAIQSGQNQARIGITAHIPGHWRPFERVQTPLTTMALPAECVTVAETVRTSDYATGYIGKWHLGNGPSHQPDQQGYQLSAVINGPHLPGRFRSPNRNLPLQPQPGQYRTDYEAALAEGFINQHRDQPFFLIVSPFAVHIPLAAMAEKVEKYRAKAAATGRELPHPVYAAMIEHFDDMVGRIVDQLDRSGLREDTLIIVTSDNGGLATRYDYRPEADDLVTTNAPLRGEKGQLYEGGIRVPLILNQPGRVTAGSESDVVAISYDFYPTIAELAGAQLPANQPIDGVSLVPLFDDPSAPLERTAIHFHYPHYHHHRPASAIREGRWKLIEYLDNTNQVELFDLETDLAEAHDLSSERAGRVADLRGKLRRWREEVVARMPVPNPHYTPERAAEWWSLGTGKPVNSDARKRFPATELEN